ncbi:MAG: rhodanese-like domain-containing protein [Anaerovoracaceae bacterium]
MSGEDTVIALAGPANKQGRIAADNICGIESSFKGSQGSSVLKLFDMTIASTGLNEKLAKASGADYDYVILSGMSHAAYYPGAKPMTIKVLFEKKSGRILGGQIVGSDGADKRIDVIATAVRAGMDAADLTELDLAYAPPYSSAKDPVNMAGYAVENILEGVVKQVHWDDVEEVISSDKDDAPLILDVRTDFEYGAGHIDGSVHIPLDDLRERIEEVPAGRKVYVYCHSGLRSYLACRILTQRGIDAFNVSGGYGFYVQSR